MYRVGNQTNDRQYNRDYNATYDRQIWDREEFSAYEFSAYATDK